MHLLHRTKSAIAAMFALLAVTFGLIPSLAQAEDSASAENDVFEEIVVTGSRIRRSDFDTPTPTVTFGKDEIEESGSTELSEILLQIPGVSSSVNAVSATAGSGQRSGLDIVDLRSLGANRTLTLIDGRRAVSNRANNNSVSLSTIPSGFVDTLQVTTGGASAVYGSDAIAGVINIITEDDFEGIEVRARYRETDESDNETTSLDFTFGTKFADGKGYGLLAIEYDDREGILARDRPRALIGADFDYDDGVNEFEALPDGSDRPASELTRADFTDLSDNVPGGNFENEAFYFDENGLQSDLNVATDGFDTRFDDSFVNPRERLSIAGKINFELSDRAEIFGQVIYNELKTQQTREVGNQSDSEGELLFLPDGTLVTVSVGRIPLNNAFAQPFDEIIDAGSSSGIDFDRAFNELGIRHTNNDRKTIRSAFGIRGDFADNWQYELSAGYGRYEQEQERTNNLNVLNLREALQTAVIDGEIVCASAEARADGCVPANLFGINAISPEAAAYINTNLIFEPTVEQTSITGFVDGPLMELPAGNLGFAAGFEWRKDEQSLRGNPISSIGGFDNIAIPEFDGEIKVIEVFTEFSVPLLKDQFLAESLTFDTSFRAADYDIDAIDTVFSYTAGLQWRISQDVALRGQFSRAQRAPDLSELFSPPRGDFDNVTDICDGVTADPNDDEFDLPNVGNNCRADPGIATFLAENPGDALEQDEDNIAGPNAGNRDLIEETADTTTFGIVLSPRFIPGLRLSLDFFEIEIEDAIDSLSGEEVLDQCFSSPNPAANTFCTDVTRDGQGQLTAVVNRQFNLNGLDTRGYDIAAQYDFRLPSIPGEFDIRLNYTRTEELIETFTGPDGRTISDEQNGVLDAGNFDDRGRITVGYRTDRLRLRWRTNFYGDVIDDPGRLEDFREDFAEDPTIETPLFLFIDEETFHDFYAEYKFGPEENRWRIFGGVNNVFDNQSPFLPSVGDVVSGSSRNIDSNYPVTGRNYYLGVRWNLDRS